MKPLIFTFVVGCLVVALTGNLVAAEEDVLLIYSFEEGMERRRKISAKTGMMELFKEMRYGQRMANSEVVFFLMVKGISWTVVKTMNYSL